jgi:hypothetical protein
MSTNGDDRLPWRDVQYAYARWYYGVTEPCHTFQQSAEFRHSEDFGDFAESITTLMTFGPNPRQFDPPIYPTRSEATRMGHYNADVLIEDRIGEDDA